MMMVLLLAKVILALVLVYGAYVAEVYRAGLESVHWSQTAAARSLGLSYPTAILRVLAAAGLVPADVPKAAELMNAGGDGLSGTGPKAGGPLYLLRLLAQCPAGAALRAVMRAHAWVHVLAAFLVETGWSGCVEGQKMR